MQQPFRRLPACPSTIALAALLACGGAAAQRTTLEVIPPQGSGNTFATAISDSGYVVGYRSPSGVHHGFVRRPDGSVIELQGAISTPLAVNEAGTSVGDGQFNGVFASATWTPDGLLTVGSAGRTNFGINGPGQITGQNGSTAFIETPGLAPVTLAHLPGATVSVGAAINDSGWVVGTSGDRATLWRPGAAPQNLGLFTGGTFSGTTAVNNRGQVVGYGDSSTAFYGSFIWDSSSGQHDLGSPGGDITLATGLNDAGQVVGQWGFFGVYNPVGFMWTADGGIRSIHDIAGPDFFVSEANDINNFAQLAVNGSGAVTGGAYRGAILTLHPDWQGGNGHWEDGTHWNWAGTGVAAARLGRMHDVVINPGVTATVYGAYDGQARSLVIGGNASTTTTFDLGGGSTSARTLVQVGAGGVLRGHGTLSIDSGGSLDVTSQGRVQVNAGERMQLGTGHWNHAGLARVQGTSASIARLEAGDFTDIQPGGRIQLTYGDAVFGGGGGSYYSVVNAGQISLQDSSVSFGGAGGLGQPATGQLLVTFGRSSIDGAIDSKGSIIVSNGAEATFFGPIINNGELRISTGGAANFFGLVSGGGLITGGGEARFEGGISFGASPGLVTVNPNVTIGASSPVLMELGGTEPGFGDDRHDKIVFNGSVTLEGGPLNVVWWDGFAGTAGDSFDLFDWNGTLAGSFGAIDLPSLATGLVWQTGDLYGGGSISIAAVPEPGTWALWLAGLAGIGGLVRRRGLQR